MKLVYSTVSLCLVAALVLAGPTTPQPDWRSEGVIYLDHSLNSRLRPAPVQAVHLTDGFWSSRRAVTTQRSIPTMLELLEQHGEIDNFRRLSGRKNAPRRGPVYTDSDVYKWIEAASWAIASNETSAADKAKFQRQVESLISDIAAAQEPEGYLNTYYVGDKAHLRFTEMTRSHEGYCLGHLIQAAIAYYRATGSRALLVPAIKYADFLVNNFGPNSHPFLTGHPELEMALVELYRTTGNVAYLNFAHYLLSGVERERLKLKDSEVKYMFSGKPFTSRTEFEGHAVRALYASSGATDYFTESGDPAYKKTLDLLWTDLTTRKMYITGGVGSRSIGESFGEPYELPDSEAYAETCAAVANVMWNYRLWALTGDASYSDLLERALYNGVNSGMSLSGTLYCYRNPLASNGDKLRNPWYDTDCCPPNIERLFESLPGYFYAMSRDGVYVNLYDNSELDWHLTDGTPLKLTQSTAYPWSGDISFSVEPAHAATFAVYLRWPAWAPTATVEVNGEPFALSADQRPGSFIPISRIWKSGDKISLNLAMQPMQVVANPRVTADFGRLAMQRGPLVYALEQIDQNGAQLPEVWLRRSSQALSEFRKDLLGGVAVLKVSGQVSEKAFTEEPLYQPLPAVAGRPRRPITLLYIPYYAMENREPTPMEVWTPMAGPDHPSASAANVDRRP